MMSKLSLPKVARLRDDAVAQVRADRDGIAAGDELVGDVVDVEDQRLLRRHLVLGDQVGRVVQSLDAELGGEVRLAAVV